MEYTVDKSHLQTSLEKKIEELGLGVEQYVLQISHCPRLGSNISIVSNANVST